MVIETVNKCACRRHGHGQVPACPRALSSGATTNGKPDGSFGTAWAYDRRVEVIMGEVCTNV
jgi:hypothetical protein